jgi:predicted 3-demethylubiquinone-9 3-methyltransferase (glyoxalase superfamily)
MPKISPFLWFNGQAEEATQCYVSLFKNSKVLSINRYGEGAVMSTAFELDGQHIMALNGGPQYTFTEAVSFLVNCETQAEVDELWTKLTEGGEEGQCGWLKDKFGLSWQIVPAALGELLGDPDPAKAGSVLDAMLKMHKIDTAVLRQAYDNAAAS